MLCVYCLCDSELRNEQILVRGDDFYLCAPRGQLVEGYLVIAPYRCFGCLAMLPYRCFAELARMKRLVLDFYRDVYGIAQPTFYEQGRAGGGASTDEAGGFPLHAHLCCLPCTVDVHGLLSSRFLRENLSGPHELAAAARSEPYVYAESGGEVAMYVPRGDTGRAELERMRLKPEIATLLGLPERGHWRAYPGDQELERVIQRFTAFQEGIRL
ncbi:hypothetical protein BH24GEM3_BH24GEM3_14920 [soil metagenome]